jgi:hypothetical protein
MRRSRLITVLALVAVAAAVGAVPSVRRAVLDVVAPSPVCEEVDRLARLERRIDESLPRPTGKAATPQPAPPAAEGEVVASFEHRPDGTSLVRIGAESIPLPPRAAGSEGDDARQRARASITAAIAKAVQAKTKPTGRVVASPKGDRDDLTLVLDAFVAAGVAEVALGERESR